MKACRECGRPTDRELCRGHRAQQERGLPLHALRPRRSPLAKRLEDATHAYFEAETDEEFERARARFRMILRDARLLAEKKYAANGVDADPHGQHSSAQSCESQATGSGDRS